MWHVNLAVFIFTLFGLLQVSSTATSSVEGLVLDGDGKPLAGATVFVGTLAKSPRTTTNSEGRFKLDDVPPGFIGLNAFKESDGYPYDMFSFYTMPGTQLPKFDLVAGETRRNEVIHLGAKAAFLKLNITDEQGLSVNAGLSFSRPDLGRYGDYSRSASAKDIVLVPPVPFRLTVDGKGFQPWHYGGENWLGPEGLVTLKSAETLTLIVRLKKLQ